MEAITRPMDGADPANEMLALPIGLAVELSSAYQARLPVLHAHRSQKAEAPDHMNIQQHAEPMS